MFTEDEPHTESNYPVIDDTGFTPDDIEAIKKYKAGLLKKEQKNTSVLKGLESSMWGITSYSLAKFLVLTSGSGGVSLAIAATLLINNIANRDLLDSVNINFQEGFKFEGMDKMVRFITSSLVSLVVLWGAIGEFYRFEKQSVETYHNLQNTVEQFNKLPEDDKNLLVILAIGGAGVAAGYFGGKAR